MRGSPESAVRKYAPRCFEIAVVEIIDNHTDVVLFCGRGLRSDTVAYSQSPTISVERESAAVDIVRNLYRRRHLHRAFVRAR